MIARHFRSIVFLALFASWTVAGQTYTISTVPGSALPLNSIQFPGADGAATGPTSVAVDSGGNLFFPVGGIVVRLNIAAGTLVTVAGGGTSYPGDNGPAIGAELSPSGVGVDSAGNLFIVDRGDRIRKVSNGVITTVAGSGTSGFSGDGGVATSALLKGATAVSVDSAGNIYIADSANRRIREVTKGVITTIAGNGNPGSSGDNGPATSAAVTPHGIAVDSATTNLYIADQVNFSVRKITNGMITDPGRRRDILSKS